MWFFVVKRECGINGGFETPRFKYIPITDPLVDLVEVVKCRSFQLHIAGIGRFVLRNSKILNVVPHKLLIDKDYGKCYIVGSLSEVLRIRHYMKVFRITCTSRNRCVFYGNISRLDIIRLNHKISINIIVDRSVF